MTQLSSSKFSVILSLCISGAIASTSVQASLESRAGGTMVYDTDLDITWVADANLFKTLANASGNPANYVQTIINANGGVVNDTPNDLDGNDGVYNLTSPDFNTNNGKMTWFGAQAWVNTLVYGGYSDWRLPTNPVIDLGDGYLNAHQAGSEMPHLFYNELGGVEGGLLPNTSYFSNDQLIVGQSSPYWSSQEYGLNPKIAWIFDAALGLQAYQIKSQSYLAWAVRSGDVAAVPVPGAMWMMGTGLLGLLGLNRRNKIQ